MRIRRRPQAQALPPSQLHHPSDPSTAPPPPANQHHWLPGKEEEVEARKLGELHRPNVDLWDEPSRPPQGNNVVGGRGGSESTPGRGGGGGAQRQAGAAADGHGSLENGHRDEHDWPVISAGEERLADGVMPVASPTAAVHGKDGPKRRRGLAVLLEGSRCSRVNGRGWRCSQPTLVGYSLCEHHLGKGRQSRSAASANGGGRSASGTKLGRHSRDGRGHRHRGAGRQRAADPAPYRSQPLPFALPDGGTPDDRLEKAEA